MRTTFRLTWALLRICGAVSNVLLTFFPSDTLGQEETSHPRSYEGREAEIERAEVKQTARGEGCREQGGNSESCCLSAKYNELLELLC